jgi:curved DNA-binding protein CbpA
LNQAKLFNKPEVEPTPPEEETFQEVQTENNGWSDPYNREVLDNKKEEGFYYVSLDIITRTDLNGTERRCTISSTYEMPRSFLGSCYGSGGEFDLDNPQKFFDEEYSKKLSEREEPYRKLTEEIWEVGHHKGSEFYRLVPMKNFLVIVSNSLKRILKEKGFDFDEWYEKYKAIEENEATPEYNERVNKIKELLTKGTNIEKKADIIKESISRKLGETARYGKNNYDSFPDKGVDELLIKLKEIKAELDTLNQQILETGKEHYEKIPNKDYKVFYTDEIIRIL